MTVPLPFAVEQHFYTDPTNIPAASVFSRLNLGDAHDPLTFTSIELIKRRSTVAESAWNYVDDISATKTH